MSGIDKLGYNPINKVAVVVSGEQKSVMIKVLMQMHFLHNNGHPHLGKLGFLSHQTVCLRNRTLDLRYV